MSETPPGWHPDPVGRHEHRYWDGTQWTDHVADQGQMSTDPLQAAPPEETTPVGPSMVNLPAISPDALQVSAQPAAEEPAPAAAAPVQPEPVAAEPTPAFAEHTPAYAESAPVAAERAAAEPTGPVPTLGLLLTVVAPGAGHVYLNTRREIGFGLLAATLVAIVCAWLISWPIGALVYVAALAFALFDLRPLVGHVRQNGLYALSDVPTRLAWTIVAIGGGALAIGLLLPWYRISAEVSIGGQSQSFTDSASGFQAFDGLDVLIALVGIAAVVLAIVHITQSIQLPPTVPLILSVAAGIAWLLIIYRLVSVPGVGEAEAQIGGLGGAEVDISTGRGIGALLDYAAAFTILFASLSIYAESRAKLRAAGG